MNTVLGDDSSPTDKIVIESNSTGSAKLRINNLGGQGAQTPQGIKASFDGENFEQNAPKNRYETKLGIQAQLSERWNLWASVGYQVGKNDFSSVQGIIGVKHVWWYLPLI